MYGIRNAQRGSALIMTMIFMVVITGIVFSLFIMTQSSASTSNAQVDYENAMITADIGINTTLAMLRSTEPVYSYGELLGFVGQNPDDTGGDVRTVTGSANGVDYTVQVRSAYLAYGSGNPNPPESDTFMTEVSSTVHNDTGESLFDYYIMTSASAPTGRHDLVRGEQVVLKVTKESLESRLRGSIPSPLYVSTDPDIDFKGNMGLSGKDHWMDTQTGDVNAKKSSSKKTDEFQTGGAGAEDDYTRTDDEARPVSAFGYGGSTADSTDADSADDGDDYPDEFDNINISSDENVYTEIDGAALDGLDACTFTQIDLDALAKDIIDNAPNLVTYDTYGSAGNPKYLGSKDDFQVTYVKSGGTLAGHVEGGGILIIDGDLHISGQMTFYGIVIVLGEVDITGGGNWDTHVYGSTLAKTMGKMTGNADVWWSSEAVDKAISAVVNNNNNAISLKAVPLVWRTLGKADLERMDFPFDEN
ncbi:MAG: hypothetical protein JXR97_13380 [Planctomycetes bacterium]|nr:hypothetical protein [Planctomycetota bacterium]